MNKQTVGSRVLKVLGGLAMVIGTVDPMEGSVLILGGSGMMALGMYLSGKDHSGFRFWVLTFSLILAGVVALFGLSAVGGIGGPSGRSVWWGLLMLPYPIGWLMALGAGVHGVFLLAQKRKQITQA